MLNNKNYFKLIEIYKKFADDLGGQGDLESKNTLNLLTVIFFLNNFYPFIMNKIYKLLESANFTIQILNNLFL